MVSPQSTPVQLPLFVLEKRCCTCAAIKALDDFHRNGKTSDGHTSSCKECARARARLWHHNNKERVCARGKEWRATHADELAARKHAYYLAHKAESQAYHRARYEAQRSDLLAQSRANWAAHRTERLCAARERRARYRASAHDYVRQADEKKRCPGCDTVKALSAFYRHGATKDGYAGYCILCTIARARHWYRANRAKALEARRTYHHAHAERLAQQARARREANREGRLAEQRAYRVDHREELAAKSRQYRQIKPALVKAGWHRRRARERNAVGAFSAEEWEALCARYGGVCLCCGASVPLQPDHIVPLSRGGSNSIDNIQPLCAPCNWRKHTRTIDYRPKTS